MNLSSYHRPIPSKKHNNLASCFRAISVECKISNIDQASSKYIIYMYTKSINHVIFILQNIIKTLNQENFTETLNNKNISQICKYQNNVINIKPLRLLYKY